MRWPDAEENPDGCHFLGEGMEQRERDRRPRGFPEREKED